MTGPRTTHTDPEAVVEAAIDDALLALIAVSRLHRCCMHCLIRTLATALATDGRSQGLEHGIPGEDYFMGDFVLTEPEEGDDDKVH